MRKRRTSWRSSTPGRNRRPSRKSDSCSRLKDWTWTGCWTREAKDQRAEALVRAYARREPEAIERVNELLASSGETVHGVTINALLRNFNNIERIDRLLTIAETRRNISLREIDRHRAVRGEALRRQLHDVEDADFEVIAAPPAERQRPVPARRHSPTAAERPSRRRPRRSSRQ